MKKTLITIGILIGCVWVWVLGCVCVCVFSIPFMFFLNNLTDALTPPPDLRRYVTQDELVGVWVHTLDTERIIARDKPSGMRPSKCHLTLYKDGACDFDSLYGRFDSFAYRTSSGRWRLEYDTKGDSNVRKKNAIAFDMEAPGFAGNMYLNLKERNGKLILWVWHSDPDSRESIEYVKEKTEEKR